MKGIKVLILVLALLPVMDCAAKKSDSKYSIDKEVKEKVEEYTVGGWKIHGSSRTLKGKLMEHYEKLNEDPNLIEVIGTSTGCRSITVCRASAINAASVELALKMGQEIKGETFRDLKLDESSEVPEEFNKFNQACISKFQGAIKGELVESFAMVRSLGNGQNSYEIYFFLSKETAKKKREQAILDAIEDAKLDTKYSDVLKERINDEFNVK